MVVFGLILVLLAGAVVAYMWLATAGMPPVSIDYGFLNVQLSPLWLFLVGGITLAVLTSGIWLMAVGARSSARRHKEVRDLRRQAQVTDRRADDRSTVGRGDTARGDVRTADRGAADRGASGPVTTDRGTAQGGAGADGPILPRYGSRADAPRNDTPPDSGSLDVDR